MRASGVTVLIITGAIILFVGGSIGCQQAAYARRVPGSIWLENELVDRSSLYLDKEGRVYVRTPSWLLWSKGNNVGVVWLNSVFVTSRAVYRLDTEFLGVADGSEPFASWKPRVETKRTVDGILTSFFDPDGRLVKFVVQNR